MVLMCLFVGLLAGICSGLFGIGGGVIIVPLIGLLFQFNQQNAVATSLVALLLPVGALGVWQYYRSGFLESIHWKTGLLIALGLFLGTLLGSKIAVGLSASLLKKMFAAFLVIVAIRLWWTASST